MIVCYFTVFPGKSHSTNFNMLRYNLCLEKLGAYFALKMTKGSWYLQPTETLVYTYI